MSITTFSGFYNTTYQVRNLILRGKYWSKIRELHEQYGPVIRINPYELHISDQNLLIPFMLPLLLVPNETNANGLTDTLVSQTRLSLHGLMVITA
jgi:hypothetical protein